MILQILTRFMLIGVCKNNVINNNLPFNTHNVFRFQQNDFNKH